MSQPQQAFKWVGTRPVRPDGVPKVTGAAKFGADYHLPGMLYGKVLRSPHAHARIRSIDTSRAEALPGVKAVMTGADLPDHPFAYVGPERLAVNFWHVTRNIMAREKVLYEGHAVAAVAAISAVHREPGARPHRRGLRGAAPRHRRGGGDGGGCAAAVRGHGDARDRSAAGATRRTSPSGSASRSAMSTRASPGPTRSSRSTTGPRPSTRRTSSRRRVSRTGRAAARRSCGAPARGTSRCATSPRSSPA